MGRKPKDYVGQSKGDWVCIGRSNINGVELVAAERTVDGKTISANFRLSNWISGRLPSADANKTYRKTYMAVYFDNFEVAFIKTQGEIPVENLVDSSRPVAAFRMGKISSGVHADSTAEFLFMSEKAQVMKIALAGHMAGVTTPPPTLTPDEPQPAEYVPTLLEAAMAQLAPEAIKAGPATSPSAPKPAPTGAVTPNPAKPWEAQSLKDAAALLEDDEPLHNQPQETLPPARPIRDELEEGISLLTDKLLREGKMPENGIPQYKTLVHRRADSKLYQAECAYELARLIAENPLNPPERLKMNHRVPPLPPEELQSFRQRLRETHPEEDEALTEVLANYDMLLQLVKEHNSK